MHLSINILAVGLEPTYTQFIRLLCSPFHHASISWLQASRTLRTSLMRASWQTCITKSSVQDERLELSVFSHSGLSRAPIPIRVIPELILIYPVSLLQYDSNTPNTDSESVALPTMLWSSKRNKNKQKSISGTRTYLSQIKSLVYNLCITRPLR